MIQCYFGNGKGKTTAAIGATIRSVGCGLKVLYVVFLKDNNSAEFRVMDTLENTDMLFSDKHYNLYDNTKPELTAGFRAAYTKLLFSDTKKLAPDYRMIVLDEVLDALEFGYIDRDDFIILLNELKNDTEIVLTGHKLPDKLKEICDYISEVREIKHPYSVNTASRKGIEY